MAKQPFISHVVNGYSRYDVPESKAFSCTAGVLYPARIDFINSRDRITISQGVDVRSNPLAVPSFNPYTVRLHRFWVPLQLYHPEMRVNSSKFDMNDLSINWIPTTFAATTGPESFSSTRRAFANSLLAWLRAAMNPYPVGNYYSQDLPSAAVHGYWANADTYLAYWDIVRNYYSYSQWSLYSFAWPASWALVRNANADQYTLTESSYSSYFTQRFGNLEFLDAYYESQFYPSAVETSNNTYNRSNLFPQILKSDIDGQEGRTGDGFPVAGVVNPNPVASRSPESQFAAGTSATTAQGLQAYFCIAHPMAVVPSSPDRFSRVLPTTTSRNVGLDNINTIPQLAVASRLQEYRDLLGAGGSRFSDWLETFFASKIEHVDRPKLLFSASQMVNAQVIMNQAGSSNFGEGQPLGQQGGAIAFNTTLGRSQSYYFKEPGYMIDMISIRPVYYWSGIRPDYLDYIGADYFNPTYNDIGYQSVGTTRFGSSSNVTVAYEPCFNEYRSSYDEVLGSLSTSYAPSDSQVPLYAYWVQQRTMREPSGAVSPVNHFLFVDMSTVNSPFVSSREDNFFVNLSYSVRKKNLVNKTFATRLSNR
nr:MAG: major capsid protein [Microvirus sp.]